MLFGFGVYVLNTIEFVSLSRTQMYRKQSKLAFPIEISIEIQVIRLDDCQNPS